MEKKKRFKVIVTAHDSWEGVYDLEALSKEFDKREDADEYANSINSENTLDVVPELYRTAEVKTLVTKYE